MNFEITDRPVTRGELARLAGVTRHDLSFALDLHGVRPAFRIGTRQIPCYAPSQIGAILALFQEGGH